MLEACELSKTYAGGAIALSGVSFRVAAGELFCLVGGNGAGKSTAISCFLDFIEPSSGYAAIDGMRVADRPLEAKGRVAYVPENVALYTSLSASQNLRFFSRLARAGPAIPRAELAQVLGSVGLSSAVLGQRVGTFSKGMRQKLGLAIAVLRGAGNLIMDEPTSGLDPQSVADFMDLLVSLRDSGAAILMSTHDLFRAKAHADRLGIMREGRLHANLGRDEIESEDIERLYRDVMRGECRGPG